MLNIDGLLESQLRQSRKVKLEDNSDNLYFITKEKKMKLVLDYMLCLKRNTSSVTLCIGFILMFFFFLFSTILKTPILLCGIYSSPTSNFFSSIQCFFFLSLK